MIDLHLTNRIRAVCSVVIVASISSGCKQQASDVAPPAPTTKSNAAAAPVVDDVWFEQAAAESGVDFTLRSGHDEHYYLPEGVCGGVALFDMDSDGDLDLYLVQAGSITAQSHEREPNRLFRNDGRGVFEDVTVGSGADDRGYGMGIACGDYDNDGDIDLYITNLGENVLLRNDGTGRFTDVTRQTGTGHPGFGASAAFVDYDKDGDLDLFVANYVDWSVDTAIVCYNAKGVRDYCKPTNFEAPAQDVLYLNQGDGTFVDVTTLAGLDAFYGTGLGVVCRDFTGDGWIDIFVANDGMRDQLWANQGDGTFVDIALLAGCAYDNDGLAKAGMGVTAADIDDDLDFDLLVCNLGGESDSFFLNLGASGFADSTARGGLGVRSRPFTRFGMAWVDFDHDGYLDLFQANGRIERKAHTFANDAYAEPNLLMRGGDGPRFDPVDTADGTIEPLIHTSRAAAFGDIDNDGDIDIIVVNRDAPAYVMRNVIGNRNNWIMLRVVDASGRDAIGATVHMTIGGRRIVRAVSTAYSYLASNDPRVHVGLGSHETADEVTVRWVDGEVESFGNLTANQIITLKRASSRMPAQLPGD